MRARCARPGRPLAGGSLPPFVTTSSAAPFSRHPRAGWLFGAAIVLTAFNLRPAVTSVGTVLGEIQAGIGMSGAVAGVLTTVPVLCFGAVGLTAGRLGRRLGTERTLILGLTLLAAGLAARAFAASPLPLLLASVVGLSGIAVANVLVPVAVKQWFPERVGRMTGLYAMALAVGTALAAAGTVPIAAALGTWRAGLAVWALPVLLALVPWVVLRRTGVGVREAAASGAGGDVEVPVHHSRQAWGLTVFFGLQGLAAYTMMGWLPTILQDAGISPTRAGLLLALTTIVGAPISVVLPELAARRPDQRGWVVGLIVISATAYLGLALAPAAAPVVWSLLLGVGLGAFPLALVMIGLRAATDQGTAHLSSLTQGFGYLVAALGPVTIGIVHDATDGWVVPLGVLLALLVPQLVAGLSAGRPGHVDLVDRSNPEPALTTASR